MDRVRSSARRSIAAITPYIFITAPIDIIFTYMLQKISTFEPGGILMYAIIETGGKQYRVSEGDILKVEKLDIADNETVTFDNVVLISDGDKVSCGTPYVTKAKVTADVLKTEKGKKVLVFKKKMRKGYKRLNGHRQLETSVKIKKISA